MLPRVKKDSGYLSSRNISVLNRSGNPIDPETVAWNHLSQANLPYTFRQGAGPGNALGRVKFIFPNKHSVYLHDTPSRSLFGKSTRTFSHGCVRVDKPLMLAEKVLVQVDGWSSDRIH